MKLPVENEAAFLNASEPLHQPCQEGGAVIPPTRSCLAGGCLTHLDFINPQLSHAWISSVWLRARHSKQNPPGMLEFQLFLPCMEVSCTRCAGVFLCFWESQQCMCSWHWGLIQLDVQLPPSLALPSSRSGAQSISSETGEPRLGHFPCPGRAAAFLAHLPPSQKARAILDQSVFCSSC